MQDSFQVWDPKQIIRKAKDRHIFLFELYLVFAKDVKDTNGKAKYIYKNKLLVSFFTEARKAEGSQAFLLIFVQWTIDWSGYTALSDCIYKLHFYPKTHRNELYLFGTGT